MENDYNFQNCNVSKSMLDKEMMKLTLSLYNNPLLSREAVDEVLRKVNDFISRSLVPFLQSQMQHELKPIANDVTYSKAQYVLEKSKNLFVKLSTEHLRFKTLEQESWYVPPQTFEIGKEPFFVAADNGYIGVQMKPVYAAYVSLRDTLRMVLSKPGVFKEIQDYVNILAKETSIVSNIMQGDLWSKKYSNGDKTVFPIFLYFDDFETRNPLGSHAGEEKLGGVYVSLACLPPHLTAKMENIFLSTIFRSKYLKQFGNEIVFSKTIDELNNLSNEGILISIEGQSLKVFFECILILGDNLGLNTICGFSESFKAKRFCRICSATESESQTMTIEDPNLVRTVKSYNNDILKNKFPETGLKEQCVFNKVHKFHICENISVDVMHDLSEGIAAYTVGGVLEALIKTKVLTMKIINYRIETFSYNEVEKKNKPRSLFLTPAKGGSKLKIKQSSSEMLCLTRYLGLMIGDLIPAENEYWKLYICLRRIIGVLMSPTLTRGQMINVQYLIQKHNAMYIKLIGQLKPKMHFLLHYSRVMLLNGPVVQYSSIKFERKNKKMKEIALGTSCNINLPLTIAIRHQLQMCYAAEFCDLNPGKDVVCGPIVDHNAFIVLQKIFPAVQKNMTVQTLKNVHILGKPFSIDTVFISQIKSDGLQFGKIRQIFYCDNTYIYFHVQQFDTLFFNQYYHAYNVSSKSKKCDVIINVDLVPRLPPCLYLAKNNEEFIVNRCDV